MYCIATIRPEVRFWNRLFREPKSCTCRGKNLKFMEVNPAIGSGFDATRGTFHGDQGSASSPDIDHGNDHPFHNVDYNTMMVCCFEWLDGI